MSDNTDTTNTDTTDTDTINTDTTQQEVTQAQGAMQRQTQLPVDVGGRTTTRHRTRRPIGRAGP
ncbi:hypothetical protein [Bifidobacterium boum]|uniref:hypothetical protein n=1 Tax=Bifidobacterium boum TaxID=78343 RepID=UPI0004795335|nr:hypothetical protein [Bifidobacterium boum]